MSPGSCRRLAFAARGGYAAFPSGLLKRRRAVAVRIVADENIPYVREAFASLGEVTAVPGRGLTRAALTDAEVLLVRSVTKVGPELLAGTRVRFVATATIGTDHVDTNYLRERGIGFASAPGSNANSVAEYVVAALLVVARRLGWRLTGRSIGVVGVGHVGSLVVEKCRALELQVLRNDPPRFDATGDPVFRPLPELFDCDIISLHVPLTPSGPYPTFHLADEAFFRSLRPGAVFLNTSRGAVHETAALSAALRASRLSAAVLDVWEGEPNISAELLERAALATPHIAGYSFDGKVRGTEMIYQAACEFLGVEPTWRPALPPAPLAHLSVQAAGREDEEALREAVLRVYDIEADDRDLRKLLDLPSPERPRQFDSLRKNYLVRREFPNTTANLIGGPDSLRAKLTGLGFRVASRA
jgi:erythronate-4-phosphate dehydrogenase